jgi:L1 cell adhesion molecule like protein
MPRGTLQIEVSFDLDMNGILTVSASENSSGKSSNITISNSKGRLSAEDIERMINEAEKFKDDDAVMAKRVASKCSLETYVYEVKSSLSKELSNYKNKDEILTKISEIESVLDGALLDEYTQYYDELKSMYESVKKDFETNSTTKPDPSCVSQQNDIEPTIEEID